MMKLLLGLMLGTVAVMAADVPAPVPPVDDPPGEVLNWLNLLISGLTPMVVLGIRKLVPKIPKVVLPLAGPLIGIAIDWALRMATVETGGWVTGAIYGALSTWGYEAQKEVRLLFSEGPVPAGPKGPAGVAADKAAVEAEKEKEKE